jgi:coenzyme F420-0:L-glutamate ligase
VTIEAVALPGLPEVRPGDDLAALLGEAAQRIGGLAITDVLCVAHKVVSKAEGRVVDLADAQPGEQARAWAAEWDKDPRHLQVVLDEAAEVVRAERGVLIARTRHGFVCANAGVDLSNVERGYAALLPEDSDRSARRIRDGIKARANVEVAVIISDTFGRTWRRGLTDVAIGCAGIGAILDLRGSSDTYGREMQVTEVAVVDEIASAAELVMGKATGVPAAIVRGIPTEWLRKGEVRAEIVRAPEEDLFR